MSKIEKYLEYPQDTRWATDEEMMSPLSSFKIAIEKPPFTAAGLILKSDGKTVYVDGMDHHSMILGSTGSGKSRLLCMPMIGIMANAGESFIATDPKGELLKMTSGFVKEQGYQVVILNFRDVNKGDMWNPLLIPYELYQQGQKDQAMSLLNDFVMTLTSADSSQERFWTQMAQSLILANILLLFETGKKEEIHMHSLSRLCLDYGRAKSENVLYQLLEYMNPDSIAAMNYAGVCVDAEKTQSSIMSVVHSALRVFNTQEGLLRMMADSTFDMRSFGRKKTAVYLVIPDEKSTYHFLVSIFTKQCYEMLIGEAHKEETMALPIRVNFMLDEFANLPAIPDMPNMISAARSRNIRFHLVIQSMNQLESKYGHDANTISSNCENWVYLNSKEYHCLEEISKRCGNLLDNRNQLRPLITPSRLQRLDKERGEALIFHGRHYPYITYLADISKYNFQVCTPIEMVAQKRPMGVVFHADRILQELKERKRAPLFYEQEDDGRGEREDRDKENRNASYESVYDSRQRNGGDCENEADRRKNSAAIWLQQLCEKRKKRTAEREALSPDTENLAEFWNIQHQYHQTLLYELLSDAEQMQEFRQEMWTKRDENSELWEAYEAEESYHKTELMACCGVLLGEPWENVQDGLHQQEVQDGLLQQELQDVLRKQRAQDSLHQQEVQYRNWLVRICEKNLLEMADQRQMLALYPVNTQRLRMVVITGVTTILDAMQNKQLAKAQKILSYLQEYRDCFFQYPELGSFLYNLSQLLEQLRQNSAQGAEALAQIRETLKEPIFLQNTETKPSSPALFYRKQTSSPQDQLLLKAVLRYCETEIRVFQQYLESKQ